jgi:hypothetical protein
MLYIIIILIIVVYILTYRTSYIVEREKKKFSDIDINLNLIGSVYHGTNTLFPHDIDFIIGYEDMDDFMCIKNKLDAIIPSLYVYPDKVRYLYFTKDNICVDIQLRNKNETDYILNINNKLKYMSNFSKLWVLLYSKRY